MRQIALKLSDRISGFCNLVIRVMKMKILLMQFTTNNMSRFREELRQKLNKGIENN